jgi:hypothetical protein
LEQVALPLFFLTEFASVLGAFAFAFLFLRVLLATPSLIGFGFPVFGESSTNS